MGIAVDRSFVDDVAGADSVFEQVERFFKIDVKSAGLTQAIIMVPVK